jgi:MATE family multidrug resistance protein
VFVLFFYYCGKQKLHETCWPESVRAWKPFSDIYVAPWSARPDSERFAYFNKMIKPNLYEFARLALPATLSLGSDFWRMSAIGLYSGTLGDKAVAVFNSSYRIAWLNIVVVGSFSSACATQLSIALGSGDAKLCAKVRNIGIFTVLTFLLLTVGLSIVFIEKLAMIFSTDPEVIQMYCDTKWEMAGMIFFMCFAMHFESLLYALKKSNIVFYCGMAGSWFGQVPAVVILTTYFGHGLYNVYLGVAVGYGLLLVLNGAAFFMQDLGEAARIAYEENKKTEPLIEEKKDEKK